MQAVGGGLGKAQQQARGGRPAPCASVPLPSRFPHHRDRHDEARLEGHQGERRSLRDGEIEPVATGGIARHLRSARKSAADDLTSTISTSPSRLTAAMSARRPAVSGSSVHARKALRPEQPPHPACDHARRLRLAPVRRKRLGFLPHQAARASARIISAAFSAIIIVGEPVLPEVMRGITDASATRKPSSREL